MYKLILLSAAILISSCTTPEQPTKQYHVMKIEVLGANPEIYIHYSDTGKNIYLPGIYEFTNGIRKNDVITVTCKGTIKLSIDNKLTQTSINKLIYQVK